MLFFKLLSKVLATVLPLRLVMESYYTVYDTMFSEQYNLAR